MLIKIIKDKLINLGYIMGLVGFDTLIKKFILDSFKMGSKMGLGARRLGMGIGIRESLSMGMLRVLGFSIWFRVIVWLGSIKII